jgi:hypothetical protein
MRDKPGSGPQLVEPNGIWTVTTSPEAGADLEHAVPMDEDEGDFRATPLWYALARGENFPLVEFLLRRGANASYSLWTAVWRDDNLVCRALLKSKPELNLKAHGETPIFYAARLKRLATLVLLIDAGADPSIPDSIGRDSVAIARERKQPQEIIEQMVLLQQRNYAALPEDMPGSIRCLQTCTSNVIHHPLASALSVRACSSRLRSIAESDYSER